MHLISSKISKINLGDPTSWMNKIFLTFDVDWAHDEVIFDTLSLLADSGVESTWFATHDSEYLNVLLGNNLIEVGIHPNFNGLMCLESDLNSREVLMRAKSIAPDSTSLRSHSLMQSERLMDQFFEAGFTHVSNFFVPYSSGLRMAPFELWNRMTIVPYQFQDNVEIKMNLDSLNEAELRYGFHVFNFHPNHVFLNTESIDRYERTRPLFQNPKELIKHRYQGYGSRSRLIELVELCRQS